ncbi:hypothetical protein ACN9M0_24785 [Streptomyces sp. R-07]|uniref:hypothetical protein n=1 Tax=Streptomyces sp. R-07 TaxID=3404052 RepID=UPI003CE756C0
MVTSRVPAAVAALLDILRAAPSLADSVHIEDGPTAVNLTDPDRIYVGWQPNSEAAVNLQQDFNAAGARTRDEAFVINCYAESRSGDKDMAARRDRVFEIVGVVETELRASNAFPEAPTLNGSVLWAHITTGDLDQSKSEGTRAGLNFGVACFARI